MNSRRQFLTILAGAAVAPNAVLASEGTPPLLDHILLGCSDLNEGIDFVEKRTGVRAAFGGVHPRRGTQNALLSLGEWRYLEIIAPDPKQADNLSPELQDELDKRDLRKLSEPRLVGWAAHPGQLEALSKSLQKAGLAFKGPTAGSRKRPDGRELSWSTVTLADDGNGLLPFFIEWNAGSLHPSADSPKGCQLAHFGAASPTPEVLAAKYRHIGLELPVERSAKEQLRARFFGPKGEFEVAS